MPLVVKKGSIARPSVSAAMPTPVSLTVKTTNSPGVRDSSRAAGPARVTQSAPTASRSEEHTSELQSLMRISYAVFCLKKKKKHDYRHNVTHNHIRDCYI